MTEGNEIQKWTPKHIIWVAAFVVLLTLGVGLRLRHPGDFEFKFDEALALAIGGEWLENPRIALYGMRSSVGINNPPGFVYLFAFIYACSGGDPTQASYCIIILNVIGLIAGVWWISKRAPSLGKFWSLWVLAFLAVNPWLVIFSRKIWAPDLLLPLVVGAIIGLSSVFQRQWSWPKVLFGVSCLVFLSQVHISGIFWVAGLAVAGFWFWPKEKKKYLWPFFAVTVIILFILCMPWLVYLLNAFSDFTGGINGLGPLATLGHSLLTPVGVWSGDGVSLKYFFAPAEVAAYLKGMGLLWKIFQMIVWAIMAVAGMAALWRLWPAVRKRIAEDIIAPFGLSVIVFWALFVVLGIKIIPHYSLVVAFPATLLFAYGFGQLEIRLASKKYLRIVVRVVAFLAIFVPLWTTLEFMNHIHTHNGTKGDYGLVLREKIRIAEDIKNRNITVRLPYEFVYLINWMEGKLTNPFADEHDTK